MTKTKALDLIQGTLDMLVLKALAWGPRHGYGIMRWIRATSGDDLKLEEGALYPALHRLSARDLIAADWGTSENNRRAKFYTLTPKGRDTLGHQTATWSRYVAAVGRVLEATEGGA